MKKLFAIANLLLMISFLGCFDSGNDSLGNHSGEAVDFVSNDSLVGMVRVFAENKTVALGTNYTSAKLSERPQMNVVLDYDFSIGKHEVTCGEFNKLMKPSTGLKLECDDDLPATDLTYYDAVLFANERSKAEKLDTAYTYSKASFDNDKHCKNLEGFVFRPEVNAYRLPTEAEWVLVAKSYWNLSEAWTAENSDYKVHKVCSKTDSSKRVCDLIGNAMEWVNDWFSSFRDTTLTNFAGAPDGGSLGERIVKGGSYRNSMNSINLYSRGDVYIVTSSTRAEYVGFRLAYGAIPAATWMGADGKAATSLIVPLANSAKLRSLTGTYRVKLAFRNDESGNLAYIDYSSGILSVTEIADSIEVYHPEISPDGKRVAFCTRLEGVAGKSSLYVRDLNADGTNLVKLDVESASIPRWRVLDNGDTAIVYVTDAGNNKDDAAFAATSTWQVKLVNGKFGKPEKLFDGAYHGGISDDNALAVTGARLLRARIAKSGSTVKDNARDTLWYGGEQACNVSLAKDGSKRTLFLDFAGETGQKFVGENYITHERLLMMDSTGTLVNSFASPKGFSFDHSEWTTGGENLAVATLTNADGAHSKIVLVNLSDSSVVELAEGDELWHPSLWVKSSAVDDRYGALDLDSACAYITLSTGVASRIMKAKMELFWKYRDTTELVIIGSSRTFAGVDPEYIKSMFAINMSYSAQDMESTLFFVKNYILPLMPKLKVVVLALDYDRWYVKGENWNDWFANANIPGYEYDKNHGYWKDGLLGDMYEASQYAMSLNDYEYEAFGYHRGLMKQPSEGWGDDVPDVVHDPDWFDQDKSGFVFNLQRLAEILDLAQNYGAHVVGIVFPQSPNFLKTEGWGRYGPTREAAKEMQDAVQELEKKYPNFTVLDEYHDGHHDYSSKDFFDEDHLCSEGSIVVSTRLDSLLKRLK